MVEDWHAFCSRHEIGLVDDFLNLFADGMVYRIEVDRPTTDSEPFLSHPAVQHCGRLAVFDPDPEFGWTEIVDWLHGRPPKNKDEVLFLRDQQFPPNIRNRSFKADPNAAVGGKRADRGESARRMHQGLGFKNPNSQTN